MFRTFEKMFHLSLRPYGPYGRSDTYALLRKVSN